MSYLTGAEQHNAFDYFGAASEIETVPTGYVQDVEYEEIGSKTNRGLLSGNYQDALHEHSAIVVGINTTTNQTDNISVAGTSKNRRRTQESNSSSPDVCTSNCSPTINNKPKSTKNTKK